ncbi:ribonuclease P [Thermoplasmatales archaeon ex4484_30]|nr:MAG: ribonuclease P [Thermoplasmatales archaeon ex4484_30]
MTFRDVRRERKRIALKRIHKLFQQAERRAFENRLELSDRYVQLARKIAMRYLIRMPREYKRRYCKHCYSYLLPGKNCRVRLKKKRVVVTCFNCGKKSRYPYIKEIKMRRKYGN